MGMRFVMVAACLALIVGCTSATPTPSPTASQAPTSVARATVATVVNCGASDLRPPVAYDAVALACVWTAYSAGTPVRWSATTYTQEGDLIPVSLHFESGVLLITRDMTADGFSSPANRRVWSWNCAVMTKRPYMSESQKVFFELTGCSGDAASTVFP